MFEILVQVLQALTSNYKTPEDIFATKRGEKSTKHEKIQF